MVADEELLKTAGKRRAVGVSESSRSSSDIPATNSTTSGRLSCPYDGRRRARNSSRSDNLFSYRINATVIRRRSEVAQRRQAGRRDGRHRSSARWPIGPPADYVAIKVRDGTRNLVVEAPAAPSSQSPQQQSMRRNDRRTVGLAVFAGAVFRCRDSNKSRL
uniref:Uncharacterized protein n=1 Tax=Plectus sambesii TaxID=2011161 RepID=A0A914XIL4_9BILA